MNVFDSLAEKGQELAKSPAGQKMFSKLAEKGQELAKSPAGQKMIGKIQEKIPGMSNINTGELMNAFTNGNGQGGFPGGLSDMAKGVAEQAINAGVNKASNSIPSINGIDVGSVAGAGGEDKATPAADNNPSGNPAYDENNGPPGDLNTQMTSLENKIHKTLENEIANNFTSIIDSILKNPTAQDTMTMAIASALKPSLDNAIANTSYLNEMANATGDKVKDGLLEFHEEYSEKSEETKGEAFTSFIDKMKRIQKEKVGQVEDAKKALDILGGDPNFKTNNNTGTRMGTVENQLKTIIPVDAINRKTKTVGGSRKRRQRRRTHKKKRFQPKK
jgi:hypothetical protein